MRSLVRRNLNLTFISTRFRSIFLLNVLRYGPWLYAVVMLGGLYLALDLLVLYFVFASEEGDPPTESERVFKVKYMLLNYKYRRRCPIFSNTVRVSLGNTRVLLLGFASVA